MIGKISNDLTEPLEDIETLANLISEKGLSVYIKRFFFSLFSGQGLSSFAVKGETTISTNEITTVFYSSDILKRSITALRTL